MRHKVIAFALVLTCVARVPLGAQVPAAWLSADLGLGAYGATAPYSWGIAGTARVGLAVRVAPALLLDLEGTAMGAATQADLYMPNARALPNTVGVSLGVTRVAGHLQRFALSGGAGAYHVSRRARVAGGTGLGLHAGATTVVMRRGRAAFTLGARILVLPDIGRARIVSVPLGIGVRFH